MIAIVYLKKSFKILMCLVVGIAVATYVLPGKQALAFSGLGSGSSGEPYQISTCAQLEEIYNDLSADYELVNDINCSASSTWNEGAGFIPIGDDLDSFQGSLNGQHYTISNLYINNGNYANAGLFNGIFDALISNINFVNADVTSTTTNSDIGVLAGESYSSVVTDVSANGTVVGPIAGGLIGTSTGTSDGPTTVNNSYFSGSVNGTAYYAGGLIASMNDTNLMNDYANTSFVYSGEYTGGLVGITYSDNSSNFISDSYAVSKAVTGYCGYLGGLIGDEAEYSVTNDFAAATIVGCPAGDNAFIGDDYDGYTWSNNYYDQSISNQAGCVTYSTNNNVCTAEDTDGSDPGYFYSANNAPLSSWTFNNSNWIAHSSTYPTFYGVPTASSASISNSSTSTSITLNWSFTDQGLEPITGYSLQYKLDNSDGSWTTINIPSYITITSLKPNSKYDFVLTAINNYGTSDPVYYYASTSTGSPDTGYGQPSSFSQLPVIVGLSLIASALGLTITLYDKNRR